MVTAILFLPLCRNLKCVGIRWDLIKIWVRFIEISSRSVGIWTRFGEMLFATASLSFDWKWLNPNEESFNLTLWCSQLVVGPLSYHLLKSVWAQVEFKPNLHYHMDNLTSNSILLPCAFNIICCRKSIRQSQTNLLVNPSLLENLI